MQFLELVAKRRSVRAYKPDAIEDDRLQTVLEAVHLAPSAANRQPVRLIVIHTAGREADLKRIYDRPWFAQAPILVCACAIPAQAWVSRYGKNYSDVDVAIALDHLTLAAADLGLGTCWVAAFNADAAREVLGLPDSAEPVAFIALGYPADQPAPKKRKPLAELVQYERWHD